MRSTAVCTVNPFPPTPENNPIGQRCGDYLIIRLLGRGGMGEVFLARQRSLNRKVALKVMQRKLAAQPDNVRRFRVEAEASARFSHPNIVQVYSFGELPRPANGGAPGAADLGGRPFIALEYVEGMSLAERLQRGGRMPLRSALRILRQIAAALQEAGEHGVIHRDIKPENILLTEAGDAKVTDFGLARCRAVGKSKHLTQSGVVLGTPLYMSPEQVQGKPLDPRSDIYALGVTAYCMLAGEPPYQADSPFEVALLHIQGRTPNLAAARPDLPPALCSIVARMMARAPEDRYQCGQEVVDELRHRFGEESETDVGTPALPTEETMRTPELRPRPARRRWPTYAAAALVFGLLGIGMAAWLRPPESAAPEPVAEAATTSAPASVIPEDLPATKPVDPVGSIDPQRDEKPDGKEARAPVKAAEAEAPPEVETAAPSKPTAPSMPVIINGGGKPNRPVVGPIRSSSYPTNAAGHPAGAHPPRIHGTKRPHPR